MSEPFWIPIGGSIGPTGPQGPQGPQGIQGVQGPASTVIHSVSVRHSVDQTLNNLAAISFNTEEYDTNNMKRADAARLYATLAGLYLIILTFEASAHTNGGFWAGIFHEQLNVDIARENRGISVNYAQPTNINLSVVHRMAAEESVYARAWQNSGGGSTIFGNRRDSPKFQMIKLAD